MKMTMKTKMKTSRNVMIKKRPRGRFCYVLTLELLGDIIKLQKGTFIIVIQYILLYLLVEGRSKYK